ncbi:ATP-binding protein [Anaerovorax odorimutans]|uniref:Stage 0 sporulation protein A homolog n=1 Tax=Anaerovorax odorimutans TaxID=109327 RepID=A0ABT1RS76_9FIRM|nr:ATP-binding protein [Anaerovorax odorimutans]MCQ4638058.1 ATP-binding protein [Anaerovorax odorimutans]
MKKNDTVITTITCVSSIFIINIIILLFLHNRDLSTGVAILLENSLVIFGLLLITMFVAESIRLKKMKGAISYYNDFSNSVLQHAENGLAVLDETNNFEFVSGRFKEQLGLNDVSLVGCNALEYLPKSIYRFLMEYRLIPHSETTEPVRQTLQLQESFFEVSAFGVVDKENHTKCILTIYDHTKQVLMEQQLVDQLEEMQFHIEAKESLLANVSHELKTPLNAIIGLSQILEQTRLSDRQKELVSKINTSSDYLLNLINDVLDFSKLKKGAISLESSHFRLRDLLTDLETTFRPVASQKGLHLLTDYKFDPDLCLNLDRLRMEQVMVNLINNACKFTDAGYVRIRVSVLKEFQDTITIKTSIEDTGIGIEPENLSGIFTEFYQAEGHLTKMHQGAGLGLPICKYLVEHMGGTLWAESKKGMGSTFCFTLTAPKYYSSEEEVEPPAPVLRGHGEKILVVEDTPINYDVVEDLLIRVNLTCEHADSGLSALKMCESAGDGYYSAILMDIHMPIMDGYETARKIKEMGITAPIIALTATNMDEEIQMRYQHLFCDFILKPFKYTQLYNVLSPCVAATAADSPDELSEDPYAGKDTAIENLGGSIALYEKHLTRFKTNYAHACETLEDHLTSGQREQARILAHSIKGLAGTLGLTYLARSAEALESAIDNGEENLSPQITAFRHKLRQVTDQ